MVKTGFFVKPLKTREREAEIQKFAWLNFLNALYCRNFGFLTIVKSCQKAEF